MGGDTLPASLQPTAELGEGEGSKDGMECNEMIEIENNQKSTVTSKRKQGG